MSKIDKIEELQGLIKSDPSNFEARRQLAVILMDCGFNEEALQHLLYLSKMFNYDDGIYYNLGIVYEKMKKYTKAKEAYEKTIELEPESIDAIYNLGLVYTELKEYNKAIECFSKVIDEDNQDSNSYFNLGLVYFKLKDFPQAIEYFQQTIDLNDEDIYAHFYIGNIYKEFGDLESAKAEFNKVISLSPDYSWAYFNLAVIDYEEGNKESAKANLRKTLQLNPGDVEAYKILAKILAKDHEFIEANEVMQNAINQCEISGDLLYITAATYKLTGDFSNCKKYLQEAIKNYQTLSVPVNIVKEELMQIK